MKKQEPLHEEETATMTAVVAKELKDLMEKQGLNIRMLAEQIKELKGTVTAMTVELAEMRTLRQGTTAKMERIHRGGRSRKTRVREVL